MEAQQKYIAALIRLHSGLERQGPGDIDFSEFIITQLPKLPPNPRIADIGCGAGAGALFLAAGGRHARCDGLPLDRSSGGDAEAATNPRRATRGAEAGTVTCMS